MALFDRDRREDSPQARKLYAIWELIYTMVDFLAAMAFLVGSVCFLFDQYQMVASWFFIVGSVAFALKPTIHTVRDIKLATMGDTDGLAGFEEDDAK